MFAAIDRMLSMVEPQARCEKTMAAGRAMERRDEHKCGHMFTWRMRTGAKDAVLLTLRTGKLTTHLNIVFLTTNTSSHNGSNDAVRVELSTPSITHYKGLSPTVKLIAISCRIGDGASFYAAEVDSSVERCMVRPPLLCFWYPVITVTFALKWLISS